MQVCGIGYEGVLPFSYAENVLVNKLGKSAMFLRKILNL